MAFMTIDGHLVPFVRRILKRTLFAGCIAGMVLYLTWSHEVAFGFFCGTLISMLNFFLMYRDASDFGSKQGRSAGRFITWRFFMRYGIMCGYLAVIAMKTSWSPVAACVGLVSVQAVILAGGLMHAAGKPGRLGI